MNSSKSKDMTVDDALRLIFSEEEIMKGVRISENPFLEAILMEKPKKPECLPRADGFDLKYDALTLQYREFIIPNSPGLWFHERRAYDTVATVNLWFTDIHPKIMLGCELENTGLSGKNLHCDKIFSKVGNSIDDVTFISDEQLGNTYPIFRYHSDIEAELPNRREWFEKGTWLLRIAAEKYNLADWYKVYNHKLKPQQVGIKNPLIRIIKGILQ